MELSVDFSRDSVSIQIDNPFDLDLNSLTRTVDEFLRKHGSQIDGLDIEGLLPRMVKGVAGCEDGCPADAKSLVDQGYKNFELNYIEGGILSARTSLPGGKTIELKLFPEF